MPRIRLGVRARWPLVANPNRMWGPPQPCCEWFFLANPDPPHTPPRAQNKWSGWGAVFMFLASITNMRFAEADFKQLLMSST
jgi:hypothetical protein